MKKWFLGAAVAVLGIGLAAADAQAARLGGARSIGAQRSITNPPPARQAQQAPAPQQPAAAPAGGGSRWMPILGGLALGGLLGSMFGGAFGGLIASALMLALLAFAVMFVIRMLGGPKQQPAPPMQYAGFGDETVAAPPPSQAAGFEAQPQARAANVPAGFDVGGFLRAAKLNFIRLQVANDLGNLEDLREFATPAMFEELKQEVAEHGGKKQQTDVVALNADLLEVTTEGGSHWASVRFSGMVREAPGQAPVGFEEVWNLAKPADGSSGWLLAGIQQMH